MRRLPAATFAAILAVLAPLVAPGPARAEDRDFCANRPGLGTPACTLAPGTAMVEIGLAGWDHSRDSAAIEDDLTLGDGLLRLGLDASTELELGFTGYVSIRQRERPGVGVTRTAGVGDARVALRRGLAGANGPIAIEGFVTLPTGRAGIGAGDWGAGLLLPAGFALPAGWGLALTPEIDAAVNASGSGRHLAYGGVIGLSHGIARGVSLSGELGARRDQDPSGHATDARAALSLAWQAGRDWQLDLEADAGLSAAAPRHSLQVGLARRF